MPDYGAARPGCLEMSIQANQARAITALIEGNSKQEAAAAAGVTSRTFSRWMAEPEFLAELDQQKSQIISYATMRTVAMMDHAIEAIHDILSGNTEDKTEVSHMKLRAAKIALDSALKLIETNDILKRIEALERQK